MRLSWLPSATPSQGSLSSPTRQLSRPSGTLWWPSNKAVWTLQLRHLPRHKSGQVHRSANPGRPMAMDDQGTRNDSKPNFFPDSIDRIPLCSADRSIPAVESVAGDERAAMELDKLSRLMENQAVMEEQLESAREKAGYQVEFE